MKQIPLNPSANRIAVNRHQPSDSIRWNALADRIGNLLQSTRYDPVQAMFGHQPVYIELTRGDELLAGLKVYEYASKKMPFLGRYIVQHGELLLNAADALAEIKKAAADYVQKQKPTHFNVSGYYGNADLLVDVSGRVQKHKLFNTAVVDLTQPVEALYANVNESHKRNIKKAEKHTLTFAREDNFDAFANLIAETYAAQGMHGPQRNYLQRLYNTLKDGHADLFFVKDGNAYLSTALVTRTGRYAHYAFGGNLKNNVGSGPFLHWNAMLHFKGEGFAFYNFGQVAVANDPANPKFTEGISRFKRSFGVNELPSYSKTIILSPFKYRLWDTILTLTGKK